jgi:hypothetical protein
MKMPLLVVVEAVVEKKTRPYLVKSECYVQVVRGYMMFHKIVEQEKKVSFVLKIKRAFKFSKALESKKTRAKIRQDCSVPGKRQLLTSAYLEGLQPALR